MKETSCDIPEIVIDRAHRIGKGYNYKKTNVLKVLFCVLQPKAQNNVKLKLDLTKNRYKILTKAIETVKSYDHVNYVMVDINCRLEVVFKDGSGKFFTNIMSLKNILEKEGINEV